MFKLSQTRGTSETLRADWVALPAEADARVEETIALGEARSATTLGSAGRRVTASSPDSSRLAGIPLLGPFPPTIGALEPRVGQVEVSGQAQTRV